MLIKNAVCHAIVETYKQSFVEQLSEKKRRINNPKLASHFGLDRLSR